MRILEESKNMSPIVYVVQDPSGKNILPAQEYGDLQVVLKGNEESSRAQDKLMQMAEQFRAGYDCLLLIGHPVLIGLAMHFVLQATCGRIDVLVWEPRRYKYSRKTINLDNEPS